MKKIFLMLLALVACSPNEPFTDIASEAMVKTVMIEVETIIELTEVVVEKGKMEVTQSTKTVTIRGAGALITSNGNVLTVAHLFNTGDIQQITVIGYNGDVASGEVMFIQANRDLALLSTGLGDTPHFQIGDPRKLKIGQQVLAIGYPLGFDWSVSVGIISALNRDMDVGYNLTQSDVAINPGNSGGPLINMKGELIGINDLIIPPVNAPVFTGLGFSVQSSQLIEFLARFKHATEAIDHLKSKK